MKNKLLLSLLFPVFLHAQTNNTDLTWALSGYAETYYGYDSRNPDDGDRPGFVYSHNRHNEVNLNIAFLRASMQAPRLRGNLALMAGTYANANLAAETGTIRNVFEANAGVKLSKTANLWLDAGIFGSHIGFESAIGKDCWTLTRSIMADNTPYYEAGAKLTYTAPDDKWLVSALVLNGWQRIRRVPGNSLLSFGWQVTYKPSARLTLNSSSFIGTDQPDDARRMRLFHNLYGIFQLNDRFGLTAGLDLGWEENPVPEESGNVWFCPIVIGRFQVNDRLALAGRVEYYHDKNGVIIFTDTEHGFQTFGFSINADLKLHENALWRVEGKVLQSRDAIFVNNSGTVSGNNAVLTTALAIWF